MMLADNIFEHSLRESVERFDAQAGGARVVLAQIEDPAHLAHLGVPELVDGRVVRILEKPDDPPSNYAVTGVYFYEASVFDVLPSLERSARASSRSPT